MFSRNVSLVLVVAIGLAAGCNQNSGPSGDPQGKGGGTGDPAAVAEGKKFLLDSEPVGAKGVAEVKKNAKDGDEVVVVGRVGGSDKPLTEGRATFLVVDPTFKPTMECDCPWDYCEMPKKELAAGRASVKFVDGQGKTLQAGAKELFGVKELTTVVVKGKANRDEQGNFTVVGSGIFIRKDKN